VETEADIAGWWLDGDILHIGEISIGTGSRVGTRAMMMPDSVVEAYAHVEPGTCLVGTGSAQSGSRTLNFETMTVPEGSWTRLRHTMSLLLLDIIPALAALPTLGLLFLAIPDYSHSSRLFLAIFALAIPVAVLTVLCYAGIVVALVRFASRYIHPGTYSWLGVEAWAAWLTYRLMWTSREVLFPFYCSLLTPHWLRMLGARVGLGVEASTILGLPNLLDIDNGSFLADDVSLAPYQLGAGQIRLGTSCVSAKAFVGNSGIVEMEHSVPPGALVGVLSTAPPPEIMKAGSSWLGRPAISLPRCVEDVADPSRTFYPSRRLKFARAFVESWRLLPLVCSSLLAELVGLGIFIIMSTLGFGWAVFAGGVMLLIAGLIACTLATLAKWLLTPNVGPGQQHPLWSSFVWRHELSDTFVESLAVPWLGKLAYGTPLLTFWLRSLGAKIDSGVWLESHRVTEPDLLQLDAGVTVNRQCVLQSHLFHERLMRLDTLHLRAGATLGPLSIGLPGVVIGCGTTVGPSSLIMRGEHIPDATRWLGNPVQPWHDGKEDDVSKQYGEDSYGSSRGRANRKRRWGVPGDINS